MSLQAKQGVLLRLYVHENAKVDGLLAYEWLLERAKALGINGGSAYRASAGYGRHGKLHEAGFVELAGEQPVLVEFVAPGAQCDRLLALIEKASLPAFYTRAAVEYGSTGDDAAADG